MVEPVNVMAQSPAEHEAAKTRAERDNDVAYTINHAISCGTNDMLIAPTIAALFGVQVGCADPSHNHGAHAHCTHEHHGPTKTNYVFFQKEPFRIQPLEFKLHTHAHAPSKFSWKMYRSEAYHYLRGEIIGDLVAVPLTIITQRLFPSFMDGIRRLVEPFAAPFFRKGAKSSAEKWGKQQGFSNDAPEVVARAETLYRSEMQHLPQAVAWNLYAFPIGVIGQKMGGHGSSYGRIIRNKSIGAIISNVLLLGGRALAPNAAQQWDAMNGQHIIAPVSNFVNGALGITEAAVQTSWKERVERKPESAANPMAK